MDSLRSPQRSSGGANHSSGSPSRVSSRLEQLQTVKVDLRQKIDQLRKERREMENYTSSPASFSNSVSAPQTPSVTASANHSAVASPFGRSTPPVRRTNNVENELRADNQRLRRQCESAQRELQSTSNTLESEREYFGTKAEELEKHLEFVERQLRTQADEHEVELKRLKSEIDRQSREIKRLQMEKQELRDENQKLSNSYLSEKGKRATENVSHDRTSNQLFEENTALKEELVAMRNNVQELEVNLETERTEKLGFEGQLVSLREQVRSLEGQQQHQDAMLKAEMDELQSSLKVFEDEMSEKRRAQERLQEENSRLHRNIGEMDADFKETLEKMRLQNQALADELQQLKEINGDLNHQVQSQLRKYQNETRTRQMAEAELRQLSQSARHLGADRSDLEGRLKAILVERDELEHQVQRLKSQNTNLSQQVAQLDTIVSQVNGAGAPPSASKSWRFE